MATGSFLGDGLRGRGGLAVAPPGGGQAEERLGVPQAEQAQGSCIWERSVSAAIPNYTPRGTPDTGVPLAAVRKVTLDLAPPTHPPGSVPAVGAGTAAVTAVLAGVAYLFAAELGMTLTMRPQPISTLWPPNAILFGLLLLTPRRRWWIILLGAFPGAPAGRALVGDSASR